jgi:hypothetical protein
MIFAKKRRRLIVGMTVVEKNFYDGNGDEEILASWREDDKLLEGIDNGKSCWRMRSLRRGGENVEAIVVLPEAQRDAMNADCRGAVMGDWISGAAHQGVEAGVGVRACWIR